MNEQQSPHGAPDPTGQPPVGQAPGQSGPGAQPGGGPGTPHGTGTPLAGVDNFFNSVRRMGVSRSNDRWVGGVAAGIAERFGLDPLLVRGIFFVTFFISGAGLVLYGLGWALLPERSDGRIHLQQAFRGQFDIAMLGAIAAVIIGFSSGGAGLTWWNAIGLGWINGLLWIAALAAIVWIVVATTNQKKTPKAGGTAPTPGTGPAGAAGAAGGTPMNATTDPTGQSFTYQTPAGTYSGPTSYPAQDSSYGWYGPQDAPVTDDPYASVPPPPAAPAKQPRPPKPPKQKAPRVHGPGPVVTGLVVGLSLLAGAALLLVDRVSGEDRRAEWFVVWLGVTVFLAGAGIVISGLRGRRSGVLGFIAVVGLVMGIPAAGMWSEGWVHRDGTWAVKGENIVSDETQTITDPAIAEDGLRVVFGSPTYDLSGLDLTGATAADPVRVPIEMGAGSATIIIPDGAAVKADVEIGAGSAEWDVDGSRRTESGPGRDVTFTSQEADDGGAVLVLDVQLGAGTMTITED